MTALRMVLVAGIALAGVGCGADGDSRAEGFCVRWAEHTSAPAAMRDKAEVLSDEARLVRTAPYEIADDMAVVAAANRAAAEGSGPVVTPEGLETASTNVERWVVETCDPDEPG